MPVFQILAIKTEAMELFQAIEKGFVSGEWDLCGHGNSENNDRDPSLARLGCLKTIEHPSMSSPCPPPCGNGAIGIISVPMSMIPQVSAPGGTAATAAPNVAYVPTNGSPLAGTTNLGAATDKIADLLKLLGNSNFTSAGDSRVNYNATTKQFYPSPLTTLLDQLKSESPGTSNGDVIRWDVATGAYVIGQPLPVAPPTGTIAQFTGISNTGSPVTQQIPATLAAAIMAAPSTTATAPATSIAGLNASGAFVEAAVVKLPAKTTVPYVGVTATTPSAGGTAYTINQGTVPADGVYQYQGSVAVLIKSTGLTLQAAPPVAFLRVAVGSAVVYFQSIQALLAAVRATSVGEPIAQLNSVFVSHQFAATAGAVVKAEVVMPTGLPLTLEPFDPTASSTSSSLQRIAESYVV